MREKFSHIIRMLCGMAFMVIPAGCSMIDEDQSDCVETTKIEYDLTLITNITTEIETQLETELNTALEMELAALLREYLSGIFTDHVTKCQAPCEIVKI